MLFIKTWNKSVNGLSYRLLSAGSIPLQHRSQLLRRHIWELNADHLSDISGLWGLLVLGLFCSLRPSSQSALQTPPGLLFRLVFFKQTCHRDEQLSRLMTDSERLSFLSVTRPCTSPCFYCRSLTNYSGVNFWSRCCAAASMIPDIISLQHTNCSPGSLSGCLWSRSRAQLVLVLYLIVFKAGAQWN